jgi:hypothetical protein
MSRRHSHAAIHDMNKVQLLIVYLACLAICWLNALDAIYHRHAANVGDAGTDAVEVFTPETGYGTTAHPVKDSQGYDTGQRVRVVLYWSYFEKQARSRSRSTILIVVLFAMIYTGTALLRERHSKKLSPSSIKSNHDA